MLRHIPGLQSLKAFDASARHLNFTRAAAEFDPAIALPEATEEPAPEEEPPACDLYHEVHHKLRIDDSPS